MRPDLEIIQQWVQPGHHVLDLGCGDGTLLDFLQRERGASGFGLEINPDHITTCMGREWRSSNRTWTLRGWATLMMAVSMLF